MISYDGWDREYQENRSAYLDIFDGFMSQLNYENNEEFENNFAKRIGIHRPKVAILSATEEVIESVPTSLDAKELTELSKKEDIDADVFGPLAFDNAISKKSAAIKGIKNQVAGQADILLVPNVETGNSLVKMMIYFMGACAAGVVIGGKVPVVITSRSDDAPARLASIAAAVVTLD